MTMTATERLRQLLDERGVEWWENYLGHGLVDTSWAAMDATWRAYESEGFLCLGTADTVLTPEQAVEATLGRETCKVEGSIDYGEFGCWQYGLSCGCRILWPDSEPPTFCPECGRRVEP